MYPHRAVLHNASVRPELSVMGDGKLFTGVSEQSTLDAAA